MANEHEASARARKVARLTQAIEGYAAVFDTRLDPDVMAQWSEKDWETWALAAGVHPPSSTTRTMVIATIREHARGSA